MCVVRGRVRQTPEPQGPGLGVGFRGLVVGGCGLFLRGVFLCLMCLAEPDVYAMCSRDGGYELSAVGQCCCCLCFCAFARAAVWG